MRRIRRNIDGDLSLSLSLFLLSAGQYPSVGVWRIFGGARAETERGKTNFWGWHLVDDRWTTELGLRRRWRLRRAIKVRVDS